MSGAKLSVWHYGTKLSAVPNCPFFITVQNCPRFQIVYDAKLSMVPNCPRCQIVRGAKLSTLHCGAKLSAVLNCPLYTFGAKLSGAKLSAVSNCPIIIITSLCNQVQITFCQTIDKKNLKYGRGQWCFNIRFSILQGRGRRVSWQYLCAWLPRGIFRCGYLLRILRSSLHSW